MCAIRRHTRERRRRDIAHHLHERVHQVLAHVMPASRCPAPTYAVNGSRNNVRETIPGAVVGVSTRPTSMPSVRSASSTDSVTLSSTTNSIPGCRSARTSSTAGRRYGESVGMTPRRSSPAIVPLAASRRSPIRAASVSTTRACAMHSAPAARLVSVPATSHVASSSAPDRARWPDAVTRKGRPPRCDRWWSHHRHGHEHGELLRTVRADHHGLLDVRRLRRAGHERGE